MNRDEVVKAQQQFIAEFTKLSKEEQLDFLRFNRYHHLRPINEVISIYIQNLEARLLGSFDFWKDLTNESSVQFGQKASVRLWDSNGRVQEVLFDLAQTTLIEPFEIKSTLLSNRVLVNSLADISGHDYLLGNRDEDEFLESSTMFIKDYIEQTVPNLSGYSDRQRSVALSIAQYNIFEEFGAYLDTGVGHEDFSNHILESFKQLNAEDNLLRTFSLANSFSRQLTKLINERYEQVSSLTDDLMLNQAALNHSIEEITAEIDFNTVDDERAKQEAVPLEQFSESEQKQKSGLPSFNPEQIWAMKEIIPTFYPDFPSETTDEELVALVEQMRDTLASNSNLRDSAKVNTYRDFEFLLSDAIGTYLLEHHSDNKELFNFLLNHQPIDFPRVIGKQVYEYLQDSVALKTEEVSKSDTMLEEKDTQTERVEPSQEIVKNIEAYNQIVERGYNQLYDSYMHYQDLKLKGQNVSGAYDTFDFKTTQGAVQLGYNYIGREQGTDDDSQVVFWASTDVEAYSTDPMSTPIRSRIFQTFEQALDTLNLEVEKDELFTKFELEDSQIAYDQEEVIEKVLLRSSNIREGNFRIQHYFEEHLPQESGFKKYASAFLSTEYGLSGYGGKELSYDTSSKGLKIQRPIEMLLSWSNVAERVSKYVLEGTYLTEEKKSDYQEWLNDKDGVRFAETRWLQFKEEVASLTEATKNGEIDLFESTDSIETDLDGNPENKINEITQLSDEKLQEQIIDSYGKKIGNEGNGYSRGSFNRWAELRQEEIRRNNLKEVKEISLFDDIEDVAFTEENRTASTQTPERAENISSFEETALSHDKIPTDSQLYQADEILSEMLDKIEQRKPQILSEWSGGLQRLQLFQMMEQSRKGLVSLDLQSGQFIPDETFLDKWTVEQKEMLRQRLSEVMEIPYEAKPQLEVESTNKPLVDFEFPKNSTDFYPKTPTEKVNANLAAIKLAKELKGQLATSEQQQILGKYVGWGGLADTIFDESNPRFENQRNELKALVSKDEYAEMRKSSLTAFYTDPKVIQTIYVQLQTLGFEGGRILDPSMGTGNFFAAMPGEMKENSSLYGVEIDNITGEIAQQLHQKSDIQIKGFESTHFANDGLDLVITNVPFSEVIRLADEQYDKVYPIHDYFIKKSLDLVHEGGLVAIITSTGTMDKKDSRFREELSKNANLVSAVRLPNGTFKSIAGTDVSSDLLIFQKTSTPDPHPNWIKTELQKDGKGNQINVNHYFMENPQYLLGQIKIETFNRGMLSVVRDFEQEQLYDKISEAFSHQAEAAYYGEHEASVFEEALQVESDVPQEIIAQAEPYTLFVYKNKPYYFDGKSVTPHQKSSSVTLNRNETRKNQLSRYENNKSKIFETTPKFKEVFSTKGYLDTWNNFIATESLNGVPLPEIPREILERLSSGEHEISDSDNRYHYVKGDLQNRLIIEEVVSTQYRYKVDYSTKDVQAMRQMIEMRHTLQDLLNIQHLPDYDQGEYENLRLKLNAQYDKFVDKFGAISNQANSLLMRTDDYYEFLASIEEEIEDELTKEPKIVKGTVFYEPTIQPQPTSLVVNNASDALLASLNHRGKLDFEYMESIYSHTKDEIIDELGDRLFYVGDGIYQTKEDYLSGDVKTKLLEARNNQAFQVEERNWFKNIAALEEVVPKDLPLSDITYKFGSRFIPTSLYQDFLTEVMETKATVVYDKASDSYDVSLASHQRFAITNTYGHKGFDGQKLANVLLNQKPGKIYMPDPTDPSGNKRILDQVATAVLDEKSEALKERFKQWVEENLEVQEKIVDVYNEQFNRYVVKTYDGSGLTINGLAKQFQPRPHQKNAIMRTVQELRAGYAHEVGSGKTLTMLASNMKLQELGMVHNALFVIPKPLINQFAREIYKYFPESKVLVAQPEDFTKAGRKRFVSRIATGKYHAIIIADSQFGKIAMSKAYQENYIKEQLYEARSMIEQAEEGSYTVKKAEKTVEALKTRLEKLQKTDTDSFITFEELGIDMLYVDEAHGFKNLAPYTQLENVKGVSDTRAEKSMDLMMKVEYMHNLYDNRRVVFSTGTPMSNSVVELYTMMKYTEPDVLKKYGVFNFDSWVSSFGIIENNFELTASGTFKVNRRFTKFGNVPELMNMFRETWDIQTQEMLDLPVPHAEMIAHETNVTGEQARYIESLIDRAKLIEAGAVEPKDDNMLKIVGENRKLTLDMRALDDKRYSAFDSDKLTQVVDEVFRIYTENDDKKSTQMIFSDLSVPVKYRNSQPKNSDDSINLFSAYDEIKRMLFSKGVPESEVRFIHEATEKNKEAMMRDMRVGKIRVLIGSTSKAGTGLNVQDKMIAVHHLDVPWRPSDITQRNGRLIRQGNENQNVSVHYYITKGSMDAFLWQTQENKAKVISQIMSGQSDAREMEEIGDTQINMGKYKTIAEGNPLKQEYMQLEQKFQELERSRTRFFDSKITDLKRVKTAQEQLPRFEQRITAVQNDIKALEETKEAPFNIDIYYKETTRHFDDKDKKTDVAEFLARQIQNHSLQSRVDKETTLIKIADYRGFEVLYVPKTDKLTIGESIDEKIILKNEAQYSLLISPDKPLGIFSKIDNLFESGLTRDLLQTEEEVKRLESSISGILKNQNMEFPKEEEYQHSKERLYDLRSELNPNQNVQEQEQGKTQELTR
ncbi:helicase-related protein [Lactococcus lactis]|uniref:helicase-related protein n=1 Tax=Lactococcus lactis TaxID=1358 RepID=UPI00288F3819|nr:helicase-related protein [Lactococcus lactis]MDT2898522.1 SNF2-related protein [Lactococcus lactis]